jgi:crotonobetainyl-CoA:carnitine CoA-transferase CaiB-like acyl-CoA transferase
MSIKEQVGDTSFEKNGALTGIRIIDFSHVFQGPVGSQILADYGADVIKVERPGYGDWSREWGPYSKGVSMPFAGLNRNKRSIAFDMKTKDGMEIARKLVESADVLMHNFRPGVMEKLGLGYQDVKAINPRLVYAYSSGWGDQGPNVEKNRMGHDMLARAEAGWFSASDPDQPPAVIGISSDYPAGLMLIIGILMALQARAKTGHGQLVTTDLFSVALHAHAWEAAEELNKGMIDNEDGIGATEGAINKIFKTLDGYIEISPVFSTDALRDIGAALGLKGLCEDPRFIQKCDRIANKVALNNILAETISQKTTDDWLSILEKKGVLCAKVRSFSEALQDPQVDANCMINVMEHPECGELTLLGTPVRLHDTKPSLRFAPPELGAQTEQILLELGYPSEIIHRFRVEGII